MQFDDEDEEENATTAKKKKKKKVNLEEVASINDRVFICIGKKGELNE